MKSLEIIKLLENVPTTISAIEIKIGMPKTTLQKAIKGDRTLPKKWAIKLKTFVELKHYLVIQKPKKEISENKDNDSFDNEPKNVMPDPKKDRAAWAKWMRENK